LPARFRQAAETCRLAACAPQHGRPLLPGERAQIVGSIRIFCGQRFDIADFYVNAFYAKTRTSSAVRSSIIVLLNVGPAFVHYGVASIELRKFLHTSLQSSNVQSSEWISNLKLQKSKVVSA
jgi:hypothetical protein